MLMIHILLRHLIFSPLTLTIRLESTWQILNDWCHLVTQIISATSANSRISAWRNITFLLSGENILYAFWVEFSYHCSFLPSFSSIVVLRKWIKTYSNRKIYVCALNHVFLTSYDWPILMRSRKASLKTRVISSKSVNNGFFSNPKRF